MKKSKLIVTLTAMVGALCMLTACTTSSSMSFTFDIDNGDKVKIELDTSTGYKLSSDVPFEISYKDKNVTTGSFMHSEGYDYYLEAAQTDSGVEDFESGSKDGNDYFYWNYNDKEFNYVIAVDGSDTVVIIGNQVSEESAEDVFERLTITAE